MALRVERRGVELDGLGVGKDGFVGRRVECLDQLGDLGLVAKVGLRAGLEVKHVVEELSGVRSSFFQGGDGLGKFPLPQMRVAKGKPGERSGITIGMAAGKAFDGGEGRCRGRVNELARHGLELRAGDEGFFEANDARGMHRLLRRVVRGGVGFSCRSFTGR